MTPEQRKRDKRFYRGKFGTIEGAIYDLMRERGIDITSAKRYKLMDIIEEDKLRYAKRKLAEEPSLTMKQLFLLANAKYPRVYGPLFRDENKRDLFPEEMAIRDEKLRVENEERIAQFNKERAEREQEPKPKSSGIQPFRKR
jgi:hypothetical protein